MNCELSRAECREISTDCLPSGVCVVDRHLRIHDWNRTMADWTGISVEQIIGEKLDDLYPHLQESRFRKRIQYSFDSRTPAVFSAAIHKRFIAVRATGGSEGLMYQDATFIPLPGVPDRALVVISDVSARYLQTELLRRERSQLRNAMSEISIQAEALRAAQQRATEASQSKSEFLANVSHEIRTPMTAILGFTEILVDESISDQERRSCVEVIQSNGRHLLQLINDILDISKVESGKLELSQTECCISDLLTELSQTYSVRASERGLRFECVCESNIPRTIQTDILRVKQVLINLISNGLKFTEQGTVTLRVFSADTVTGRPALRFSVTDSGIGMSEEQISRLFKPFVQVDTSATRRFGGTGLGLAICKRVAERLGGKISVTSAPGKGSCFTFTLLLTGDETTDGRPAVESSRQESATDQTSKSLARNEQRVGRPRPLAGLRVLVVDDGQDNQRLIDFRLKRDGAESAIADNGAMAVELVTQTQQSRGIDCVLMDIQMPILDGYEATRVLRSRGITTPIIALTAHAMSHDRQLCLDAGCDDYHTKPVAWDELREQILKLTSENREPDSGGCTAEVAV